MGRVWRPAHPGRSNRLIRILKHKKTRLARIFLYFLLEIPAELTSSGLRADGRGYRHPSFPRRSTGLR